MSNYNLMKKETVINIVTNRDKFLLLTYSADNLLTDVFQSNKHPFNISRI